MDGRHFARRTVTDAIGIVHQYSEVLAGGIVFTIFVLAPLAVGAARMMWKAPSVRPFSSEPAAMASVLTPRQLQILQSVAQGQTAKQIARTLDLSPRTVEMHVARVLATLQCSSRAEAVHKATEAGLLA